MSDLNTIPIEFQVLSTDPELRIRIFSRMRDKIILFFFFLPFFLLFVGHCLILFWGLYEILHLRFGQAFQIFAYNKQNLWNVLLFCFTFSLLWVVVRSIIWALLGITEIRAIAESFTITYRLLGVSRVISITADEIQCFSHFCKKSSEDDSWHLELVTNQTRYDEMLSLPAWIPASTATRANYKTISLYSSGNVCTTEWLGRSLANFYHVGFRSDPMARHKPITALSQRYNNLLDKRPPRLWRWYSSRKVISHEKL